MVKNNVYYEWFASITVPNPDQVGYWVDLGADSKGRIIKVYNRDIEKWVVLFDVSKDDYVPPFIGSNGNWWVDNRDTGVKATAETPYIGENDHWFTYDPINKVYVDTGIEARGLSAYDIAVKLGFKGSEQDWIDSLSKASEDAAVAALDAANKANEAADKANQAVTDIEGVVDDAVAATDKAEEIASNPPKIVDGDWWFYDYDTKQYVNTGIAAIGDAFTYKKEYPSVEAMEADWGTADVKLGEYVLINTNNVEDPDDAKVYLKTQEGWKFIVDLSGMQGIQGWSAYEVAVKHGFVGTEEEWVQSLKQPALDAAAEALDAKAQVETTEKAVKEAEALRVTAEQGRVNAENTRVSNENTRISNEDSRKAEESKRVTAENERIAAENSRKSEEDIRKTNEANRISAESSRASAETLRASAEVERNTNEQKRIEEETKRISSEEGRVAAETKRVDNEDARIAAETARDTAEQERESNEATRQANEAIRETQEAAREKNTADAITAVNEAKTAAQQATTNATTAANNANTQANRAKEYADNPPKVGDDGYWYLWDEVNDVYVNTGWPSSGIILKGSLDSPEDLDTIVDPQLSDSYIVGTDLYFWNGTEWVNMGRFQGPQGEPGKDAELSKAAIEAVLIGEVTTHTHDTRYYTKDQTDARFVQKEEGKGLSTNDYTNADKTKVTNLTNYVTGGTGAVTDANAATITLSKKNPVNGSASTDTVVINKATTTTAGVMSAADKTKLDAALTASDNIATATKLATARTIWGQAFDGSANISGNMTNVDHIYMNNSHTIYVKDTNGNNLDSFGFSNTNNLHIGYDLAAKGYNTYINGNEIYFRTSANNVERMRITSDGKVGIGTTAPERILDVAGGVQFKTNIDNVIKIPVKSIGSGHAPGMHFYTNDGSTRIGGIGGYVSNPSSENYRSYVGWGDSPFDLNSSLTVSNSSITYKGNKVWHADNDGAGSGLDADLLDGYQLVTIGNATGPHSVFSRPSIGNGFRFWHIGNLPTVASTDTGEAKVVFNIYGLTNFASTEEIFTTITASTRGKIGVEVVNHIGDASQYKVGYVATDSEVQIWVTNLQRYGGTSSLDICVSKQFTLVNSVQTTVPENIVYVNVGKIVTTSNLEDTLAYWYENDENNSSTTCATGGNRNVIESLRSKFKRCIAKPYGDDAALISYLNETDSNKWPDGTGATYETVRKESLMVHFPKYYHKTIEISPGIWRTYISEQQIDNDYIEEPELLLGTFEGIISDENGGALTSTGSSISAASKTIAQFVAAAKVNGSMYGIGDYRSHATIARMFCAYYKTTNISTSNSAIPCSGGTKRYDYGWTGGTKALGNRDGKAAVNNDAGYYSTNFLGLEDCYYSKWEFVQGINILKGKYVVYDGGSFPDKDVADLEAAGATNIRVVGYEPNPAATEGYNGWTKAIAQGKYGDVLPTAHGGSETTYYSDYSWFNPTANRIFLRSGLSADGSRCGVFAAYAHAASSASWTNFGARLAFYGKIVVVDSDTFKKMQA